MKKFKFISVMLVAMLSIMAFSIPAFADSTTVTGVGKFVVFTGTGNDYYIDKIVWGPLSVTYAAVTCQGYGAASVYAVTSTASPNTITAQYVDYNTTISGANVVDYSGEYGYLTKRGSRDKIFSGRRDIALVAANGFVVDSGAVTITVTVIYSQEFKEQDRYLTAHVPLDNVLQMVSVLYGLSESYALFDDKQISKIRRL